MPGRPSSVGQRRSQIIRAIAIDAPRPKRRARCAARIELDRQVGLALLGFVGDLLGLVGAPGSAPEVTRARSSSPISLAISERSWSSRMIAARRGPPEWRRADFRLPDSPVTGRVGLGVVSYRFDGHLCLLRHGVTGHRPVCGQT